uniref:60S ribosomal protein L10 n=1 Tax=Rhizophora mucronata TaxID=61149 RepID=A0A2P2LQS0_RHIMU
MMLFVFVGSVSPGLIDLACVPFAVYLSN